MRAERTTGTSTGSPFAAPILARLGAKGDASNVRLLGWAVVAPVVAFLVRLALSPLVGDRISFLLFDLAVLFVAIRAGFLPGLVATALSVVFGAWPLLLRNRTWSEVSAAEWASLAIFAFVCLGICFAGELMLAALRRERKASADLRRTEQRFRMAVAPLPAIAFEQDAELRYTWIHGMAPEFEGQSILGKTDDELFGPVAGAQVTGLKRHALNTGMTIRQEVGLPMPGGAVRTYDLALSPLRDVGGRITGIAGVTVDVTERKRMETLLKRQAEELRGVMDVAPLALWVSNDPECRTIMGNREANRLYQALPGENVSAGPRDGIHDRTRRFFRNGRELKPEELPMQVAAARNVEVQGEELEVEVPSGERRTIVGHAIPLRNENGAVRGCVAAFLDLTGWRAAEAKLRETENRFKILAESLPQLVWTAEPDGTVDYYNERIREFAGAQRNANGTWTWSPMLHPEDVEPTTSAWQQAVREGGAYEAEHRVLGMDGTYRWHLSRGFPSKNAAGQVLKWFGTATDIHDQKVAQSQLEAKVQERTAKLRETIDELESYSYAIAHDMRAPLRAMQSYASILLEDEAPSLSESGRMMLGRMANSAKRLDALITDVLNYSRLGRGDLTLQQVDVDALLRDIVQTYPNLQSGGTRIEILGPLPPVQGNLAALTQVISNLLGNAVKFVAAGTQPHVRVWAEGRSDAVRIWLEDNGIGIAQKDHQRIFNLFERVNSDRQFDGTGTGLAVVKKAIQRMNGRVGLESDLGKGSRFWIELPKGRLE